MLVAALSTAGMNATIRYLSKEIDPIAIVFFRSLFGFLVFAPLFVREGLAPLKTQQLGLQAMRGVLHVGFMLFFFTALSMVPLAKVSALNFTSPLFATVLAVLILGERLRVRRVAALAVGFAGTFIVLRPGVVEVDLGSVFVLAGSLCFAGTIIIVKLLARTDGSITTAIYVSLFSVLFSFVPALPYLEMPTWPQLGLLVLLGVLGSLAHSTFAQAFREADVTALLPVEFTKLVWAAVLGFLVFAEIPDLWTWVGGAVIFGAVAYITVRESRAKAAAPGPSAPAGAPAKPGD